MLGPKVWSIYWFAGFKYFAFCIICTICTIVRIKTMFLETLTWNRIASSALPRGYHSMNLMMLMEMMKIYLVNIVDLCLWQSHLLFDFQIQSFCFEHCRNSDNACGPGFYVSLELPSRMFHTDSNNTLGFMRLFLCRLKSAFCLNSDIADGHFWKVCTWLSFQVCNFSNSISTICERGNGMTMTRYKEQEIKYIFLWSLHLYFCCKIYILDGSKFGSWQLLDKEMGRQLVLSGQFKTL